MKQIYRILAALVLIGVMGLNSINTYAAPPGTNSRFITSSKVEQNTATITWINGNGNGRIVVLYTDAVSRTDADAEIENGTLYDANSDFSATGSQVIINDGSKRAVVVYKGTGSTRTVDVSGLDASTKYWVRAYEYKNDGGIDPEYLENTPTGNPVHFTTKNNPAPSKPTNLFADDITDKDAMSYWTVGDNTDGYYMDLYNNDLGQYEWEGVDIGMPDPSELLIDGLAASTSYAFRLNAYDDEGQTSGYTTNANFETLTDVTAPEMISGEFIDANNFKIYFTEPIVEVGNVESKFSLLFTNENDEEIDADIFSFMVDANNNTVAICSTLTDLTTVKNGVDIEIEYVNSPSDRVEDLADNPMDSPSSTLIKDWKAPRVASIERVISNGSTGYTTEGASYGTNDSYIYFKVTFEERVKAVDANFVLSVDDINDNSTDGQIDDVIFENDEYGFTSEYIVAVVTNEDNDCDDYSVYVTDNDGDNIIRDASGNVLTNTEVLDTEEGFKVDRIAPNSETNGSLNPDVADQSAFDAQAVQLGTFYEISTGAEEQISTVYNVSNLNDSDPNDLVLIRTNVESGDCSLNGGNIKLKYYVADSDMEEFEFVEGVNVSINSDLLTMGYAELSFDISQFLNPEMYEGKKIELSVVTTDIGGNETETSVYFGFFSNATVELLYDVIAPNAMYDLIKDVDVENPIDAIVNNPSSFDGINEIGAYNYMTPNDMNYNYINVSHNSIVTALGTLDPQDNTLLGGYIELKAKVVGDAEWTNVDDYYDQYLSSNIDELFEQGVNNYSIDTKYMYVRFQNNGTDKNFDGFLYAIGAEHGDEITFQVCVTDNAYNTTCYNTESSLEIDLVRPKPNDLEITKIAIGEIGLNENEIDELFTNDDKQIEYFNKAKQDADNFTVYFQLDFDDSELTDNSMEGGTGYLLYKKNEIEIRNVNGDDWIRSIANILDNDEPIDINVITYRSGYSTFSLGKNSNILTDLMTNLDVNGQVFKFAVLPIDKAGNEASENDKLTVLQSDETIILDNVAPKLAKAYSSDLSQYYLQEFAYDCYGDMNDDDDRYYFNKNTGTVGGANDVVGAYFEFELDASMNLPGNSVTSRIQYFDGEGWDYLGNSGLYSSIDLGTEDDEFGVANYPQENPTHFRVADWVNRQDVTNLWNGFASGQDLTNESDLRFEIEIRDVAGNQITVYPTPNADGNPFESDDAFIFRYDRTVPTVSNVIFDNPTGCYNISDNVGLTFTVGNNSNGNNSLTFVPESTSVNNVSYNTDSDCDGSNFNGKCNDNDLDGYANDNSGTLTYTVGEDDNEIEADEVVTFSVQVMDIAGNISTIVSSETQSTTSEQTPTIDTRLHSNYISTFRPLDADSVLTSFVYGPNVGENVISLNTNELIIAFGNEVPEHVTSIRVYVSLVNNNDNNYFDGYEASDYSGYFSFPAESLYTFEGTTYLDIPISLLEEGTEGFDFDDATENQKLYVGLKFETAACNTSYNINCDLTDYSSLNIDRVAPRIVTYETLKNKSESCANGYEEFVNEFTIAGYYVGELAVNYGYNIFTGPVAYKVISTEYNNIIGNYGNINFDVMGSEVSYTNANTAGYTVLFSEQLYLANNNNTSDEEFPIDANEFVSIETNIDANDNNIDNGINLNNTYVLFKNNNLPCDENSYQSITFYSDNLVGNGDFNMTLNKDEFVDAAGNKLVDAEGNEYSEDISITYGDINYPFALDNIAPTVSNLKVYSDLERLNQISETCLTTNDQNNFYFEFELNEYNSLRYSDVVNKYYVIDFDNESVDPDVDQNISDDIPVLIGIRNATDNNLLGVLKTTINNENYTADDVNYELYYVNAHFDFESAEVGVDYQLFGNGMSFEDLDENITFSLGFTTDEETMISQSLFVTDNYAMDIAGNTSNEIDSETSNLTIDNKAPVLSTLTVNEEVEDNMYSNASCFTATGDGNSVINFMVSVNEKKAQGQLCGETDHLRNPANWTVKIGEETLLSVDYTVEEYNNTNSINLNNDIITYIVSVNLKSLRGLNCDGYDFSNNTGEYSYYLNVTDFVGNDGQSMPESTYVDGIYSGDGEYIYIDNDAPTVEITDVTDGCYDNEDEIIFKVNVQDISFTNSPCTTDFTNLDSWNITLAKNYVGHVSLIKQRIIATTTENEYEITVQIPADTYTANDLLDLNVTFNDKVLNKGTDTEIEAVRIIVDPITAHIVGYGDAYNYINGVDLDEVKLCADVESFDVSHNLSLGEILSTKVYRQTGTEDAVMLTSGVGNDYTIDEAIITINTESLTDGDNVYVMIETICGNIKSNSFVFVELPLPTTAVITDNNDDADGEVCYDASVTFTADENNNEGYSYNWSYKLSTDMDWTAITGDDENFEIGANSTTLTVVGIADDYLVSAYKVNEQTTCVSASAGESETIKVLDRIAIGSITFNTGGDTPKRGEEYTYTASDLTNDDNLVDFTWSYSGTGVTITDGTSETVTIAFSKTATPGTLSVIAKDSKCGNSEPVEIDLKITIDATKDISFSSVTKTSMTLKWTNGTGDGKILIGNQNNTGTSTIDNAYASTQEFSDEITTKLNNVVPNLVWTSAGTFSTTFLSSNNANLSYVFLANDIDNSVKTVNISGLTKNKRYNFRLLDFINYPNNVRIYQPNSNSNTKVTVPKEGEENYGNTENFISLISPNPAKDNISFSMTLVNEQPVTIELYTIEGRQVLTFKNNELMTSGEHFVNIPLTDLAAGTYSIIIRMGNEFILDSFVVMP